MQKSDFPSGEATSTGWDLIVAGALLTRLPLPHAPKPAFAHQARAVWAYPFVGLCVGVLAVVFGGFVFGVSGHAAIAAGVVLAVSMICTGAMHEDGLADTLDGFWGGYARPRRLEIMKDSHIGTYGVLGLVVTTGLRWAAITVLISTNVAGIVAAMIVSRAVMPAVMATMGHARENGLSQSVGRPPRGPAIMAVLVALVLAVLAVGPYALVLVVGALSAAALVGMVAARKIGGQTGDVLGATQICAEITVLVLMLLVA